MVDTDYLQTIPILRLQAAARKAGLAFRNGDLNKTGIIDRLARHPMIGGACVAILQREDQNAPAPRERKPSADDWLDDNDAPAPSPTPLPVSPPPAPIGESFGDWRPSVADLDKRLTRQSGSTHTLAKHIDTLRADFGTHAARLDALEKARPIQIQIGQEGKLPPVDFGGELTHAKLPLVIQALMAGEQVYLVGPAGSGKTTAAKQVRKVLAQAFERGDDYQCLAIGAVSDAFALIGYRDAAGNLVRTSFREAYEKGYLFLWDECDASAADAQLVINALDNGFVAFPDGIIHAHPHFRLICSGNTDGSGATMSYTGRSRMDGAFRDRFAIIDWELNPRIEERLSRGLSDWLEAVRAIRAFVTQREIQDVLATARAVRRGPAFLEQGMPRSDILALTCKRGALVECWAEVLRLPAVRAFLQGT